MKKFKFNALAVVLFATSFNVAAHLNIARDNFFALGESPREYKEGSSVFIDVNAVEGCKDEAGNRYNTTDVVVIMPTSPGALSDNFITTNRDGEILGANAVMFTKAKVSRNWKKVEVVRGTVDAYRGADRTEGTRAIKWLRGSVDSNHYDNLEFRASLPKFKPESCVSKLRVELPTISYCKSGYVRAWIGTEGTTRFPQDSDKLHLEESYELYFNVIRDVENNPYPESCARDDEGNIVPVEEAVRPTDADIDLYGGREL